MLEQFAEIAAGMSFSKPQIPIVSNVTGELAREELCEPGYWVEHARRTVRFACGVHTLYAQGVRTFLEIGPDGALSAMAKECLSPEEGLVVVAPLLRSERAESETLLAALGQAWTHGAEVDWSASFEAGGARRVSLPTYAFQRRRYWLDGRPPVGAYAPSAGQQSLDHPLLGPNIQRDHAHLLAPAGDHEIAGTHAAGVAAG